MIDSILGRYWAPKHTSFWRHHLPTLFIGTIVLLIFVAIGLARVQYLALMLFGLVASHFVLFALARKRFGDTPPPSKRSLK